MHSKLSRSTHSHLDFRHRFNRRTAAVGRVDVRPVGAAGVILDRELPLFQSLSINGTIPSMCEREPCGNEATRIESKSILRPNLECIYCTYVLFIGTRICKAFASKKKRDRDFLGRESKAFVSFVCMRDLLVVGHETEHEVHSLEFSAYIWVFALRPRTCVTFGPYVFVWYFTLFSTAVFAKLLSKFMS